MHQLELGEQQLVKLVENGAANRCWHKLSSCTAASAPQPQASEGAAAALVGDLVLVLGGYLATGATKSCWAWRLESRLDEYDALKIRFAFPKIHQNGFAIDDI